MAAETYEGGPCKYCGGTTRWARDRHCVNQKRCSAKKRGSDCRYNQSEKGRERDRKDNFRRYWYGDKTRARKVAFDGVIFSFGGIAE